jgi:hypothetical protein
VPHTKSHDEEERLIAERFNHDGYDPRRPVVAPLAAERTRA